MYKKILLLMMLCAFSVNSLSMGRTNMIEGQGVVYTVIDGDTFVVNATSRSVYNKLRSAAKTKKEISYFNDYYKSFRIRLGAIDTAESTHFDRSRNTAFGKETSDYVKNKMNRQKISFSCWDFGKFGRIICSIRLGKKDLGLHLIKHGMSTYYKSFGLHPYLDDEYERASK